MPKSSYQPRRVAKKTHEVVGYHYDTSQPGKPLHLLVPGGAIAIATLAAIIGVIYQTWFAKEWSEGVGSGWLMALVPVYIGAVFIFSLGYELYEIDRALALTAMIVFSTVAIVLVVAVIAVLLGAAGNSSGSSSKKSSSSGSSGGGRSDSDSSGLDFVSQVVSTPSTSNNSGSIVADVVEGVARAAMASDTTGVPGPGPNFAEEVGPDPAICTFCGSTFIPESTSFKCPQCGGTFQEAI